MNDSFQQLVRDALDYARAQPPQAWTFASPEEVRFLQSCAQQPTRRTEPKLAPVAQKRPETPRPPSPIPKAAPEKRPVQEAPIPEEKFVKEADVRSEPQHKKPVAASIKPSEEIVKTLRKIAPALIISDHIPDDQNAKKIASAWKEKLSGIDVVLLALNSLPDTIELMKNLAKAIQKDLGQVKLMSGERLEQEKRWDLFFQTNTFRLVIASPGMEQYPDLLKHYKALPAQQSAFLANTPLIVLEPASVYTDSPDKKISLWKSLCQTLKK
ncbi:MAG: hypothetical protein JSR39_08970 [Verrucomicrobia bacterium]|nr:hypothetical protein [Verrucomicrobiota bacterium]